MTKDEVYKIDEAIFKQIQETEKMKQLELKKYIEGMLEGAEIAFKAIRDYIDEESKNKGGL